VVVAEAAAVVVVAGGVSLPAIASGQNQFSGNCHLKSTVRRTEKCS
jgi:hypothetical protein